MHEEYVKDLSFFLSGNNKTFINYEEHIKTVVYSKRELPTEIPYDFTCKDGCLACKKE